MGGRAPGAPPLDPPMIDVGFLNQAPCPRGGSKTLVKGVDQDIILSIFPKITRNQVNFVLQNQDLGGDLHQGPLYSMVLSYILRRMEVLHVTSIQDEY